MSYLDVILDSYLWSMLTMLMLMMMIRRKVEAVEEAAATIEMMIPIVDIDVRCPLLIWDNSMTTMMMQMIDVALVHLIGEFVVVVE